MNFKAAIEYLELSPSVPRPPKQDLRLEVFVHNYFQGAKELSVLGGQAEFGVSQSISVNLLTVHNVYFAAFVEANGDFQNQKEVVAGTAYARHDLGDPLRLREGFVDRVAQFFDQAFEIIV
jgi:hypothetical protein